MKKIKFINPFGTDIYDNLIEKTLTPYVKEDTELSITHLKKSSETIDYYYNKHLAELEIFDVVRESEEQGYDAVIVGCAYDPGVRAARELVDIPVVGPLEASLQFSSYFGHSTSIVTDHHKATPYLKDLVNVYGYQTKCTHVEDLDWWTVDMVQSPEAIADDAYKAAKNIIDERKAESVILGCTIISSAYEEAFNANKSKYDDIAIINPNTIAFKTAEMLADLYQMGKYNISRSGFYDKQTN